MNTANGPKEWLKGRKTATAEDLSNDIWVRIERVNRVLDGIIAQFGEERVERLMTDASEFVDAFNEAVKAEEGACARK